MTRIEHCHVKLELVSNSSSNVETVVLHKFSDFADFCDPKAKGALLKACVVFAGIVTEEQAKGKDGGDGQDLEQHLRDVSEKK